MPDILGTTNPVPGYDKANVNRNIPVQPEKVQIQNSPNLERVSRADGKTEQQDNNLQGDGKIRYDSNFHAFLQRLQGMPDLTESLARIFTLSGKMVVQSGLTDGVSEEMAQIMTMMQMDQPELTRFLSAQIKSGSQLNGALFALLRNAYSDSASGMVREDILRFAKHYLDYASRGHVEGNIQRELTMMTGSMPSSWAERLSEPIAQLKNGMLASDVSGNVKLLQKTILPTIARYIEQTHDMGLPRELTTMLALDIARYDNGKLENVLAAFHRLASYGTLKNTLGQINDETLQEILKQNQTEPDSPAAKFADKLASMASKGVKGNDGAEVQEAYRDLIHAMLMNESVYMPLNHYLLPLQWNGRMLFSEMWVDPDAENQTENGGGQRGRTTRVLIKLDVQHIGAFDILLQSKDDMVDINISYPEAVSAYTGQIEQAVTGILTQNDLRPGAVTVRKMGRPLTLTEVFPKIFEGMNSINVKI